ncbi:uncharacterized protein [Porites lutea]|uniref:uncharacterized protein n=1 Tax=Porites lutea TaxID=51062 RepID=UPI003CC53E59
MHLKKAPALILLVWKLMCLEADICQGVCTHHNPAATTIATSGVTAATTKKRTSFNIADPTYFSSDITTLAKTSSLSERKTAKKDSSTVVIVAASLGTVLFVALIALAALVLLKRRRRHSLKDSEEKPKKKAVNQPENSYESIDPVEDAKLLGDPNTGKPSLIKTEEVEYDMVNKKEDTKQNNRDHVGVTKQATPKMDHKYAVVNKKNQKQKKGDVVYAQLDMPRLDDAGNNTKVRKHALYAPTVYADVKPTGVINKAEPNSKLPTYENVQKTTVGV